MKSLLHLRLLVLTAAIFTWTPASHAALLAYEPFTNAPGTAIIGSGDGSGFSGVWQSNSSSGVATNTSYALGYTDTNGNVLLTAGGAGFFQGLTSASTAMQPIRLFNFSRGTNGTDATTTWISFLIVRQGPTGNLTGNPYGRGANIDHDFNTGSLPKLAIGNSSGAATNTVGLIPQGGSGNLKSSTNTFGNFTNFVVVRIDHNSGALDNAWLFVNPSLAAEPSTNAASASSLGGFDYSFDRVRVFAGGQSSAAQPYAEMVVDEYRVGETYADVTPHTNSIPAVSTGPLVITNLWLSSDGVILSGAGGSSNGAYYVLGWSSLAVSSTNWPAIATNSFSRDGRFRCTNPVTPGGTEYFYRLLAGGQPSVSLLAPFITAQPQNQSVTVGNNATFSVTAGGTAPLFYQWYFNTNTLLANAAGPALTITNAQATNAGAYSVIVSNSVGSVSSAKAALTVSPAGPTNGAWFVSPSGNDANSGTIDQPFLTISKGLTTVGNGGLLYLMGGTYLLPAKLGLSRTASPAATIRIWAYPGEKPFINSTNNTSDGISISGSWYHLKGIEQAYAGHNGINISGNSNLVENCIVHDNGNSGLHITGGQTGTTFPAGNLILNCDSYLNYDPPIGGNADGFSAKWNLGPGNVFSGCRSWWNSDDGWDLWMGTSPVVITNCWAFWSGTNYWNSSSFNGNGNGFKLGGNYIPAAHRLVRSVSFVNQANGVDQNNNTAGLTVDNVTSWANGKANFALAHGANTTPHIVRNDVSIAGVSSDSFTGGTLATNNSWQVLSPAASTSDVLSVDTSLVTGPRQADGSLPVLPFLRPAPGGRLIDRGVDVGDPYSGAAPELGAFEYAP